MREDAGRILRERVAGATLARCRARRRAAAPCPCPTSAAGRMPTGVSTLKRPPTAGGMSSAGNAARALAISRSAPFFGSVTNTRCAFASRRSLVQSGRARRGTAPSSPPCRPTSTSRRTACARATRRSSSAAIVCGSTLSSTCRRGLPAALGRRSACSRPARAAPCAARSGRAPSRRCRARRRRRTVRVVLRGEVGATGGAARRRRAARESRALPRRAVAETRVRAAERRRRGRPVRRRDAAGDDVAHHVRVVERIVMASVVSRCER